VKAYRVKGKIDREWQDFLDKTNGNLRISLHCLERVALRFPDMLELTKNEFLALVRAGKPVYIFYVPTDQRKGIVIRNGKLGFAVSFDTAKIMTTFPYKQGRVKQITLNPRGGDKKKKSGYHRPSAKKNALKEIEQEF
jgi:hypothetical protein